MASTHTNRIQQVNIDLIKPYWRNPRKNDEAVPYVARSIQRYGFNVPLLLDAKNCIVLGHTRYRAARQLNLKTVPCIIADLTEEQCRQFRIADNKTSELAKWDPVKLEAELRALINLDDVKQLFGGPEWDALLRAPDPVTQGDVPPSTDGSDGALPTYEVTCPHCGKENVIHAQAGS